MSCLVDGFTQRRGRFKPLSCTGAVEAIERLLSELVLPASAPSLGGVETLITRPVTTSHSGLSREERAAIGIADGLVRVACGIEVAEDL